MYEHARGKKKPDTMSPVEARQTASFHWTRKILALPGFALHDRRHSETCLNRTTSSCIIHVQRRLSGVLDRCAGWLSTDCRQHVASGSMRIAVWLERSPWDVAATCWLECRICAFVAQWQSQAQGVFVPRTLLPSMRSVEALVFDAQPL
ncbi:unnamed protein product [Symbiodinium sp. CCMP2592]|nr:unnamed protein product [Symbiodinium sp. CCMP2592]